MGRKKHTKEFKAEAVRLSERGEKTIAQVAADLGITESQLHVWRRAARERGNEAFPGKGKAGNEELAEWKRRALRAEQERDILKKTVLIFAPPFTVGVFGAAPLSVNTVDRSAPSPCRSTLL